MSDSTGPAATFRPAGHACDAECWYAHGPASECVCSCGGRAHGARREGGPAFVPTPHTAAERLASRARGAAVLARIGVLNGTADDADW